MTTCDVCEKEDSVGVASIPGMPVSVAYGRACLRANAHPWRALVSNTAVIGGLEQSADWWRKMVEDTCRHLGKTLAQFNEEVADEIRADDAAGRGEDA